MAQQKKAQEKRTQQEEPKTCFVICPIGDDGSPDRKRSDEVLKFIIAPAIGQRGYGPPVRADEISEPGNITRQVIQRVTEADLVIADLTTHNPNVFYELAIRHAIGKPVITIMENGEKIPFDVAQDRVIFFDSTDLTSVEKCKQGIIDQLESIESGRFNIESPVSLAVEVKSLNRDDTEEGETDTAAEMMNFVMRSFDDMRSSMSTLSDRVRILSDRMPSQTPDVRGGFESNLSDRPRFIDAAIVRERVKINRLLEENPRKALDYTDSLRRNELVKICEAYPDLYERLRDAVVEQQAASSPNNKRSSSRKPDSASQKADK
ncbi:hypothetical protein ACFL6S_26860 [Candidatus Poribacteria bacterium]